MKKRSSLARAALSLYWQHAWKYKGYVIGVVLSVPLAILTFRFLPQLIVANILDRLSRGDFVDGAVWASFGWQLVGYVLLTMLGGILMWRLAVFFIWKLEMKVARDIYRRIFNHLVNQSAAFHANRFGGSLVSQTNKFAGAYIRLADTIVFQLIGLVVSFLFTAIILTPRAPLAVAALFFLSGAFMLMSVRITGQVRRLSAEEASAQNKQTGYLADSVSNVLAVKSFASEDYEKSRFAKATDTTMAATNRTMKAAMLRDLLFASTTTTISSIALILAVAGVVLLDADIATVYLIISYTGIITENLWQFSQNALKNINRALGDAQEMTQILMLKPDISDPAKPEKIRINRGEIRFKDVTFAFPDSKDDILFDGLDLHIKPGEKVGLVGHSGGGKTTITKLLLRFMDISTGKIEIDDQNIASITQNDLRARVAYVPQEPLLFHRTLRENIGYGSHETSDRAIIAAAKMANAHEFIEKLPSGYETLVGERGVKLSGGQRQRVAIARALLKNAPILLLDEATSALDSESEQLIQEALWRLMEGRTALVIAHRLSTIQKMDRIIVMEEGRIAEQGTHKELVKQDGVYGSLWRHQSGGFLEE